MIRLRPFAQPRHPKLVAGLTAVVMGSWAMLWQQASYWNPLFFATLWLGATVLIYLAGPLGYPGVKRHMQLAAISVPLWWWFELVNLRVGNWTYLGADRYGTLEYVLLTSIAFSTVVPALHSAWRLFGANEDTGQGMPAPISHARTTATLRVIVGVAMLLLTFAFPRALFPLVWVAPFLILDGLVSYAGGHSLVEGLMSGRPKVALQVAAAGLLCGFLWEFWNYWAEPRWIYSVPMFGGWRVFEMPILGYLGYVPFVWSVYQLVQLMKHVHHSEHRRKRAMWDSTEPV